MKSGGRLLSAEGVGVADEGFGMVLVGLLFVVTWFLATWKLPLDEILAWLVLADVFSFTKDDDDGVFLVLSAATIGAGLADGLGVLITSEVFFIDVAVAVVFLGVDGIATDWLLTGFHDLGDMAYTKEQITHL